MGTSSNDELEHLARIYNLPLIAVCQRDRLKDYDYVNNGFYIINTESSVDGFGKHWQCLYLNKNMSFYFCSFGNPPPTDIIEYVRKYSKHFINNNMIIQNINSDNCGYFCIGFILFMIYNKYNYTKFLKAFDETNSKRNDGILEGLIRLYTNKTPSTQINKFFKIAGN
jgi:hypothetical protein